MGFDNIENYILEKLKEFLFVFVNFGGFLVEKMEGLILMPKDYLLEKLAELRIDLESFGSFLVEKMEGLILMPKDYLLEKLAELHIDLKSFGSFLCQKVKEFMATDLYHQLIHYAPFALAGVLLICCIWYCGVRCCACVKGFLQFLQRCCAGCFRAIGGILNWCYRCCAGCFKGIGGIVKHCCSCCCGRGRIVKMMKAPGRNLMMPRHVFECNPKIYFQSLRSGKI